MLADFEAWIRRLETAEPVTQAWAVLHRQKSPIRGSFLWVEMA